MSTSLSSPATTGIATASLLTEKHRPGRSAVMCASPSTYELLPDAELLQSLVVAEAGSATARLVLAQIVERHGTLVYQVALRLVGDTHLADDVFQATFLVLAQSDRRIKRSSSLASWLHGTARNIGRRALAQKRATMSDPHAGVEMVTSNVDDPFTEMMRSHERQLLDEELHSLSLIHREPLVLHHLEERSNQEIAQLLGITVAAVESRLKRARQELRLRLVRRGVTLSIAVAALGAASSTASAAPSAALVSSTITLASTKGAASLALATGTKSLVIQLAGKELTAMSAASKLTALCAGIAGAVTVGGVALLGAASGGTSGIVATDGDVSIPPSGVIGTDLGLSGEADCPPALLALVTDAQATSETNPASDAAASGEVKPVEKGSAAPATTGTSGDSSDGATTSPDFTEADTFSADSIDDVEYLRRSTLELLNREPKNHEIAAFQASTDPHKRDRLQARLDHELRVRNEGPSEAKFRPLSERERAIYEELALETSLQFPDNTLREVIDYISQSHDIAIQLDHKALSEAGIDPETRINMTVSGIKLRSALALMLENVEGTQLDYTVDHEILHITTADKVVLRYYDLVGEDEDGRIENFAQAVEEYATKGMVSSEVSVTSFGDSLAIRATLTRHRDIEEFIAGAIQLADRRRANSRPLPSVPHSKVPRAKGDFAGGAPSQSSGRQNLTESTTSLTSNSLPSDDTNRTAAPLKIERFRRLSPEEVKIYRALEQPLELKLENVSLTEFVKMLSESASIPVLIDHVSFDAEAINATTIKFSYSGKGNLSDSLQNICDTAVTGVYLDYYISRGVLFISTHVGIEKVQERYYDLSGGDSELSLGQRVQVYLKSIGQGESCTLTAAGGDTFAISAPLKIHRTLDSFLIQAVEADQR